MRSWISLESRLCKFYMISNCTPSLPPFRLETKAKRRVDRLDRIFRRWAVSLAFAAAIGVQVGRLSGQNLTPYQQVQVAVRDLATIDPARREYIRYIAIANTPSPDTAARLINFWLNSYSWSGQVEIMPIVDSAVVRVQFDLFSHIDPKLVERNLQRWVASWEWLAEKSPYPESYFQVPTEIEVRSRRPQVSSRSQPNSQVRNSRGQIALATGGWSGRSALEALKHDTKSVAPIVRFEWWHAYATSELGYYAFSFTQRTKGLTRLFQDLGVDREQVERLQARSGRNILMRRLNNRPARMQREAAPLGAIWITFDVASDEIQAIGDPHRYLDAFEYQGNEIIYKKPNGSHGFAVSNAAGDLLTTVPDTVAKDSSGDGRLVVGRSCVTCHIADGLHDFAGNFIPIRTDDPADAARHARFYRGDIERHLTRDREDYRRFVALAAGGWTTEQVAASVAREYGRYLGGWKLGDVARYLGISEPYLRLSLAGSHDPIITALTLDHEVRIESIVGSWPKICLLSLGEKP